ncbi:pyridoxamine 5'-phosphate oxidase family protein [Sinomonas sp. JGH33]|uniref:Pyridoxamine 5'-phosphate oxidase family protein n=1 Tax=Sinomonas terricola TaxID=3110330 RepID=A0ABU5T1L7_9MICC|nr:pyridoxamine 5'-phosphate oxidase family protein [Sinomonas sp. JGH33]MEA5453549.1 pyridoxamine 5'-phosphate oxidase family protein [Sinomonas sp. JGH33]
MSTVDFGYGPGARHQDINLDEEKCWSLLGSSGIGRFAFLHEGRINVFPVHYVVHRGGVYFRTSRAGTIASSVPQGNVALQIDSAQPQVQAGWTVLVSGDARPVEDEALVTELFGLSVSEPWAGGVRDYFVGLAPTALTGRQVFLA